MRVYSKTMFWVAAALLLAACSDESGGAVDAAPGDAKVQPDLGDQDGAMPDQADDSQIVDSVPPDQKPKPDFPPSTWPAPLVVKLISGRLIVEGRIDNKTAQLVVDTGVPTTVVDKTLASGFLPKIDLDLGPIAESKLTVKSDDFTPLSDLLGLGISGQVGQDIWKSWYVGLDYRTPGLYLAQGLWEGLPPHGDALPTRVGYKLAMGQPMVQATILHGIGNASPEMLADTGSPETVITQSTFDAVDVNGDLPQLGGYLWRKASGSTEGFVTRLPTLKIGSVAVEGSWAVVVPDDHHMAAFLSFKGMPVEYLGYPFFSRFLTVVAGSESGFLFYPGAGRDAGEWTRAGIEIVPHAEGAQIDMVFQPSAAWDAGLRPEDLLLQIDGTALQGMELEAARALLRGSAGQTLQLTVKQGQAQTTIGVEVEDLLPALP